MKYELIVGKEWPKFDSGPGKDEHYEVYVLEKSRDGTFINFHICFLLDPSKTAMNNCGIVTMKNLYQIYNSKHHAYSSKMHEKDWKENNSTKIRKTKSEEKLGRR